MAHFVLGGVPLDLEKEDVLKAVKDLLPGPIRKYAIKIHGEKYPIKQVLSITAKRNGYQLEVAQFTAHDAYRVLKKLGFDIMVEEL